MTAFDFVVVGAGMAGASAAFELAAHGRVALIEREDQPGYHSTGRSAALYTQTYGPPAIRALTIASRPFFEAAPRNGFAAQPVLTPRGTLLIGRSDQLAALDRTFDEARRLVPSVERLDEAATLRRAPMLRPGYAAGGVWEPEAMDLDVHAIHMGFLRGLKARGGVVVTDADLLSAERRGSAWELETRAGRYSAPVLVNAAGAWADAVARIAGVPPVGIVPRRRTAVTFEPDPPLPADEIMGWPMVIDVDERFYFKPESGRILASPADETPVEPCDAQPEELDVAIAVDRVVSAVTVGIRRITHKWAGLRSFAPDKVPVVGFDPLADGFFWLAGQGGYGIQTAPAMARTSAELIVSGKVPQEISALGVRAADLAPARLRSAPTKP